VVGNILTIGCGITITHRFYRQSKFINPILIKVDSLSTKDDKESRQIDIISIIGACSTLIFGLLITLFTLFLEKNILDSLLYFVSSIFGSVLFGLLLATFITFPLMILDFIFLIDHKIIYFLKKIHKLPDDQLTYFDYCNFVFLLLVKNIKDLQNYIFKRYRCSKCNSRIFSVSPFYTSERQIMRFIKKCSFISDKEPLNDPWLHPGSYCPKGCLIMECEIILPAIPAIFLKPRKNIRSYKNIEKIKDDLLDDISTKYDQYFSKFGKKRHIYLCINCIYCDYILYIDNNTKKVHWDKTKILPPPDIATITNVICQQTKYWHKTQPYFWLDEGDNYPECDLFELYTEYLDSSDLLSHYYNNIMVGKYFYNRNC
jgi:uncharacterized protein YlaI